MEMSMTIYTVDDKNNSCNQLELQCSECQQWVKGDDKNMAINTIKDDTLQSMNLIK
jgi:hypothetical protein